MSITAPRIQEFDLPVLDGEIYAKAWWVGDAGVQPPIILLHDSLGCVDLWRDFPQTLAQASGRSVIAYDRLGFGQSSPKTHALPPDFVLTEAQGGFAQLLTQLALDDFIVLGHSVGGGMGIAIAAAYPECCRALVTISAQAFVEERTRAGIRAAARAFAEPGQMQRLEKYHGDKARWVLDAWVNTWLSPAFADWNLDRPLARVVCPILAIHGQDDEYGSVAHPQRIAARAGAAVTLECIPACGHLPHREQTAVTLKAITHFLETI